MKRTVLLFLLFFSISVNAQRSFVSNARYEPFTFDEMAKPLLLYKQMQEQREANIAKQQQAEYKRQRQEAEYNQAHEEIKKYFNWYSEEIMKWNLPIAKLYLDQIVAINNGHDKQIVDEGWVNHISSFYYGCVEVKDHLEKAADFVSQGNYEASKLEMITVKQINESFQNLLLSSDWIEQRIQFCDFNIQKNIIVDSDNKYLLKSRSSTTPITVSQKYQTVVSNRDLTIKKIINSVKNLTIEFELSNLANSEKQYNIDAQSFIVDKRTNTKYTMLYAEGIVMSPAKTSIQSNEKMSFKLVFPAIPDDCYFIDLIEAESSEWKFYNLKVK